MLNEEKKQRYAINKQIKSNNEEMLRRFWEKFDKSFYGMTGYKLIRQIDFEMFVLNNRKDSLPARVYNVALGYLETMREIEVKELNKI